ncbi:hypothetical protein [Chryseobacterium sp.]|uniref:hypothetical protein n=1 Tax=Chryseobacterium sp. TaxID=1871047 RepID=UPI0028964CA2|nr:hypothetical protein [Chryseobacterium sp.]
MKLEDHTFQLSFFLWQQFPPSVPAFLPPLRSGKKSSTQVGLQSRQKTKFVRKSDFDNIYSKYQKN